MQAPASREPRNSAQTPRRTQEGQRHDATPNRNAQGNQHERRGQARENSRENSRESQRNGRTHSETTGSAPASRAEITGDHRTRIVEHKSAFRAGRLDTVPFAVTVGTAVPRSVTLHAIPPTIVEVVPGWRSYRYVMVRDEILIIDPATMRIVAVVDA